MNFKSNLLSLSLTIFALTLFGCVSQGTRVAEIYPAPKAEADWIRNAEPIEFENEQWFPVDDVENLLDDEMLPMGISRSVQFFVEKADIKPYHRVYTKFGKHKYRVFERSEKR